MKTEHLLLIAGGLGLVLYSQKAKPKVGPVVSKPVTGTAPVISSKTPPIVQSNPNSQNPNVTVPDLSSVIDGVGRVIDIFTPAAGTTGAVVQPTGNSDNPSFDAGDKIQEAYGSTDMGDYAEHLDDEEGDTKTEDYTNGGDYSGVSDARELDEQAA